MQSLYLATQFNPIYWNTACLVVNSGSLEDNSEEEVVDIYEPEHQEFGEGTTFEDLPDRSGKIKRTSSTDYKKLAKAIGKIRSAGINVSLANINKSQFGFIPDAENNQILFGLKGMLNVGDDIIAETIAKRPYSSPKDYLQKVQPKRPAMIALIKGGAFDDMMDRKLCMAWYLWETCGKKTRLTLQNMSALIKYNLLPQDEESVLALRVYEFNRYLKAKCKTSATRYTLDERALCFLSEIGSDNIVKQNADNNLFFLDTKEWDKIYQSWMDLFRDWIAADKENILKQLNEQIFLEEWHKYADGNISSWEMEVLCFYYHEHELLNINKNKYGIVDFNSIPENPVVDSVYHRGSNDIKLFKLYRICGTCIAKKKEKGTVTILTTDGVVDVKFRKEYFALFDKQISEVGADGAKHVVEKSFFNRGSKIIVTGIRDGDSFISKKYSSTGGHQLYKIDEIFDNGDVRLRSERYKGTAEVA